MTTIANLTCASPPVGATGYTFDSSGNRTKSGTKTFGYDQANRLSSASTGSTASYTYDGTGLRTGKTVNGNTTTCTWDGANLATDGTTSYIYGPGGLPIEQIGSGGTSWYFHDQQGNTRALVGSTGPSSWRWRSCPSPPPEDWTYHWLHRPSPSASA
ncbi:hypothetical protein [Actinokineospora inagensis]|uniref:hypothetical protein n=1 Tax=Actinokineospora inagensis TaxID=103730 RepID=UPI0004105B04|nr:hypothetical protein [Actinokineospora inagensis]